MSGLERVDDLLAKKATCGMIEGTSGEVRALGVTHVEMKRGDERGGVAQRRVDRRR